MSSAGPPVSWSDFTEDPRAPHSGGLRASDRDRAVASDILGEAYADGRLTRTEYDERAGVAAAAKTLGELPELILDLLPQTPVGFDQRRRAPASTDALHRTAVQRWESQRRQALIGFLIPTIICWAVWVMTGLDNAGGSFDPPFPWPLFVMLGTAAHLTRVLMGRQEIIADELRRLEKRQRRSLEGQGPPRPGKRPEAG